MIRHKNPNQLKFDAFKTPFEMNMNRKNRWVLLSELLPWEELIKIYNKSMSNFGRPALDARIAIGAMIIKAKLGLSDEETVEMIRENVFMQYFLGLEDYQEERLFDPSLLVHIRERMGKEMVDEMNNMIVAKAVREKVQKEKKGKKKISERSLGKEDIDSDEVNASKKVTASEPKSEENKDETSMDAENIEKNEEAVTTCSQTTDISQAITHKGVYILDATIADQYIKYPTDVELLNDSREKSEEIIDVLYSSSQMNKKPRTYRRIARKRFLEFAKKKNKTNKQIERAKKKQLSYLVRNLRIIENFLDTEIGLLKKLNKQQYRNYLVIQEIYRQQKQMYEKKENRCEDRIVSISQPHVRPMVRGKQGKIVEFGQKALAGIIDEGYSLLPKMEWDAYNEGKYVELSAEHYKIVLGYYPEVIIGDRIFITRSNRLALQRMGIRLSGKSLGRKSELKKKEEIKRMKEEQKQRVKIEGKFGQGKNGYELNKIRMRKSRTSESMVSMIFLVMNLIRYAKQVLFWPFVQKEKLLNILEEWLQSRKFIYQTQ